MKYKAIDDKEFETEKECEEYENLPTLWIVTKRISGMGYGKSTLEKVFITEEEAEFYKKDNEKEGSFGISYCVTPHILERYIRKVNTGETVLHETKVSEEEIKAIDDKRESCWSKILRCFNE